MYVIYDLSRYKCEKAFKMEHEVIMFDENDKEINRISNIYGDEWNYISVEGGEWIVEPTDIERLQEEVDVLRADLDYCLMLLEE